jgi:very-short-patch-repair endonuclease
MNSMKPKIPYEPYLVEIARKNRNNATYSERIIWNYLKGGRMMGFDFHRQKPILKYIVDFFCEELMLAIEIDGITHHEDGIDESNRQKEIEALGIHFVRLNAMDVLKNPAGMAMVIEHEIMVLKGG